MPPLSKGLSFVPLSSIVETITLEPSQLPLMPSAPLCGSRMAVNEAPCMSHPVPFHTHLQDLQIMQVTHLQIPQRLEQTYTRMRALMTSCPAADSRTQYKSTNANLNYQSSLHLTFQSVISIPET